MKRNFGETTVKGFVIDLANGQSYPFETKTNYVRSAEKAQKMIDVKELGFENGNFAVAITELINDKAEQKRYSNSKVIDNARLLFDKEEEANNACNDNETVRKVQKYYITGQIWAIQNNEYFTETYGTVTSANLTKCDLRAQIKMHAAHDLKCEVIAVHGEEKTAYEMYAVIENTKLANCIIPKKAEKAENIDK